MWCTDTHQLLKGKDLSLEHPKASKAPALVASCMTVTKHQQEVTWGKVYVDTTVHHGSLLWLLSLYPSGTEAETIQRTAGLWLSMQDPSDSKSPVRLHTPKVPKLSRTAPPFRVQVFKHTSSRGCFTTTHAGIISRDSSKPVTAVLEFVNIFFPAGVIASVGSPGGSCPSSSSPWPRLQKFGWI